jgi:hypothetical protein
VWHRLQRQLLRRLPQTRRRLQLPPPQRPRHRLLCTRRLVRKYRYSVTVHICAKAVAACDVRPVLNWVCVLAAPGTRIFASPLAKKLASAKGIDLAAVRGTGPHNRIIAADVEEFVPGETSCSAIWIGLCSLHSLLLLLRPTPSLARLRWCATELLRSCTQLWLQAPLWPPSRRSVPLNSPTWRHQLSARYKTKPAATCCALHVCATSVAGCVI